jgi:FlaG/FlaF family flagellin (archaellin)
MKRITRDNYELAVSPVVGVMLMLVVVIIIAAVVSGFSGGLLGNQEKAPTLTMDVKIKNTGYWSGSYFSARVTGAERAIDTNDLKIVTKWSAVDSKTKTRYTGGNTVVPGKYNVHLHYSPGQGCKSERDQFSIAPTGYGTGVGETGGSTGSKERLTSDTNFFGNYSLKVGTTMWAQPYRETARPTGGGYTSTSYIFGYGTSGKAFTYVEGDGQVSCADDTMQKCAHYVLPTVNALPDGTAADDYSDGTFDSMTAVLGQNWHMLRAGDTVSVSVIHTPTGRTIWQKDVIVEG